MIESFEDRDFEIIKEKTLFVTGHRKVSADLDLELLEGLFVKAINSGYDTFLVGMAVGFDTVCFQILERLKAQRKAIKIIACIPCPEQDKYFNYEQKREYERLVNLADRKIIISPSYTNYCMIKRNRFMVDNSSYMIAYLTENHGGTFSTVKYAKEKGLKCEILTSHNS